MELIRTLVVGCGDRACVYCEQGVHRLKEMEVVGCVDPDPLRLSYMQEHFGVSPKFCFSSIEEVLKLGKIADCVINGTMDNLHKATSIPFLKQGYNMLLEKPIVNNEKDLLEIKRTAEENHCILVICHVLRYSPFYKKIKELILDGEIGKVININTSERVGAFHSSVSYLRGKWNSEKKCGSSLLLAKCCHDIDLICWLNNSITPKSVFSTGGRDYFLPENAPKGSGTRCLVDCPESVREKCIYDVKSMYLDNCMLPQYPWVGLHKDYHDVTMAEKIESLKTDNPHGLCVFKAGGDLVDHQQVFIRFHNGSLTCHTLVLGCMKAGRSIWVAGSEGEIEGFAESGYFVLRKYDKKTSTYVEKRYDFTDKNGETGGHFGGDAGLIKDFCNRIKGGEISVSCTSIEDSINGHLTVYAADESLKEGRAVNVSKGDKK